MRVKYDDVACIQHILLIIADQMSLALLNKTNDIIVMKVIGEFLHNALELISFKLQIGIKYNGSYFTIHAAPSFS
jgi:hypothetical protein